VGGRPIAIYTLAPGEVGNIISVRRGAADYFYHYDGMGNVIFLTDSAGNKAAEYVMDSFGNIAYTQGASVNSYLWRTLPYDSSIESYQQAGRIYCSKITSLLNAEDKSKKKNTIDEAMIPDQCGPCEWSDPAQKIELEKWAQDYLNAFLVSPNDPVMNWSYENYARYVNGKEGIAETKCHILNRPETIYYETSKWDYKNPRHSCCNNLIKYHESIHAQQCKKYTAALYLFFTGFDLLKWSNLEKEAYQETYYGIYYYLDKIKEVGIKTVLWNTLTLFIP